MVRRVFDSVSWLVASARTATAMVWVPALPPTLATIGVSTASTTSFSIVGSNAAITEEADHRGAEIGDQPARAGLVGFEDRLVDVAIAGARQQQRVLAGLFLDDVDDVVDGDDADQPPGFVDHRGGDQRVFLELQRHFLLVHGDRDQRLFALHDIGDGDVGRGGQQPRQPQVPTGWRASSMTKTSQKSVAGSMVARMSA